MMGSEEVKDILQYRWQISAAEEMRRGPEMYKLIKNEIEDYLLQVSDDILESVKHKDDEDLSEEENKERLLKEIRYRCICKLHFYMEYNQFASFIYHVMNVVIESMDYTDICEELLKDYLEEKRERR